MHLKEVYIPITAHLYSLKECKCEAWINHHSSSIHHDHHHTHTHTTFYFAGIMFCRIATEGSTSVTFSLYSKHPMLYICLQHANGGCCSKAYFQYMPFHHTATTHHPRLLQQIKTDLHRAPVGKPTALCEVVVPQATLMPIYYSNSVLIVTNSGRVKLV